MLERRTTSLSHLAIDRIINNLDRELKSKQKELEQSKVNHGLDTFSRWWGRCFQNSDKDIDERINEEKRNTDKYEVKLRNAQNKVNRFVQRNERSWRFLLSSSMRVPSVRTTLVFHPMAWISTKTSPRNMYVLFLSPSLASARSSFDFSFNGISIVPSSNWRNMLTWTRKHWINFFNSATNEIN